MAVPGDRSSFGLRQLAPGPGNTTVMPCRRGRVGRLLEIIPIPWRETAKHTVGGRALAYLNLHIHESQGLFVAIHMPIHTPKQYNTHLHKNTQRQTHTSMHVHTHTNTCAGTCTRVHTHKFKSIAPITNDLENPIKNDKPINN